MNLRARPLALTLFLQHLLACRERAHAPANDASPAAPAGPALAAAASGSAPVVDAAAPSASAPAAADDTTCSPSTAPRHLARIGCTPEELGDLVGRPFGFSKNGRYLGGCIAPSDQSPFLCDFDDARTKSHLHFEFKGSYDICPPSREACGDSPRRSSRSGLSRQTRNTRRFSMRRASRNFSGSSS